MFTVWNAYGADCADVESPTRAESHYLAEFPTEQQAEEFAADAYNVMIHQCPEWQSLSVFVTDWQAPEGAPVIVADLFADLTVSHLERLMGGSWEAHGTGGNCSALAPLFGFMGDRKVDVLVTDSESAQTPDSTTEAITVGVFEYPNGNEIRTERCDIPKNSTPLNVAHYVGVVLRSLGMTCH